MVSYWWFMEMTRNEVNLLTLNLTEIVREKTPFYS